MARKSTTVTRFVPNRTRKHKAPVRSQYEGLRRAHKVWVCTACEHWHVVPPREVKFCSKCDQRYPVNIKQCVCGSKTFKADKPKKCEACGLNDFWYFASRGEANYWQKLRTLEKAGHIKHLRWHVKVPLKFCDHCCTTYTADFMYYNQQGKLVVDDTKGSKKGTTELFKLKRELFYARYKIRVNCIFGGN